LILLLSLLVFFAGICQRSRLKIRRLVRRAFLRHCTTVLNPERRAFLIDDLDDLFLGRHSAVGVSVVIPVDAVAARVHSSLFSLLIMGVDTLDEVAQVFHIGFEPTLRLSFSLLDVIVIKVFDLP
jgi:hypothetical protein